MEVEQRHQCRPSHVWRASFLHKNETRPDVIKELLLACLIFYLLLTYSPPDRNFGLIDLLTEINIYMYLLIM